MLVLINSSVSAKKRSIDGTKKYKKTAKAILDLLNS